MNIVEPILFHCRHSPTAPAICAPGTEFNLVSYSRLGRFINNVGRIAIRLGLEPGQKVAVFVSDPILHAAIILGLMRIGVVVISGRNPELPREIDIAAVIADTSFPYSAPRIIAADANWVAGDGKAKELEQILPSNADDICQILLTSGTTGYPKAVALTHEIVSERILRRFTGLGNIMPQCSRTYCGPGFSTGLGAEFLIYMLWRGGTFFCSAAGSPLDSLIRAFIDFEVENIVAAPAGLASLLECYERDPSIQYRIKAVMSGGSLLSATLADRIRARISSNVISAYGSSETGLVASSPIHAISHIAGAVGHVVPGVTVEIVNPSGNALPPGAEGTIRIRTPCKISEYYGQPPETEIAFRDGWFYPGDIGVLTDEKLLIISGREKSVVNLGGDTVKPEMLEDIIASYSQIDQAAVIGVTNELGIEELWSLLVTNQDWNEEALRAHCATRLPPGYIPTRFFVVDTLPRNHMGKLDRARLTAIVKSKLN